MVRIVQVAMIGLVKYLKPSGGSDLDSKQIKKRRRPLMLTLTR